MSQCEMVCPSPPAAAAADGHQTRMPPRLQRSCHYLVTRGTPPALGASAAVAVFSHHHGHHHGHPTPGSPGSESDSASYDSYSTVGSSTVASGGYAQGVGSTFLPSPSIAAADEDSSEARLPGEERAAAALIFASRPFPALLEIDLSNNSFSGPLPHFEPLHGFGKKVNTPWRIVLLGDPSRAREDSPAHTYLRDVFLPSPLSLSPAAPPPSPLRGDSNDGLPPP